MASETYGGSSRVSQADGTFRSRCSASANVTRDPRDVVGQFQDVDADRRLSYERGQRMDGIAAERKK
jgi:hypothetical protein